MKTKWLDEKITYDGSQLRSLFGYLDHGVLGDSIVGWRGPCDISREKIVDAEDLRANERIAGSDMIHFIVEIFEKPLSLAVAYQRLLTVLTAEILSQKSEAFKTGYIRKGDDLFLEDKKLNISIATNSPGSALIHFGINVSTIGTPVPTEGLDGLGVSPLEFAENLLDAFSTEVSDMEKAACKVKWVR